MRAIITIVLCLASLGGQAKLVEEVIELPVTVQDGFGRQIAQPITVTVFSDDRNPRPAPVLVLNHGRSAEAQERVNLGRAKFSQASRFFVEQGFIVAVPTRIGYGVTGGEDVEDSGSNCGRKNYPPAYAASAVQTLAVLAAMRQRPDASPDRAVIVGQSFGGMTAVTVAALNPPGVQATINFAGGGGGNPKTQPQRPCSTALLERMFRDYGRTARIPMLWVYTENDMYFGPEYPRQWHAAFTEAGGKAEFMQYPPHGEDGHSLFTRFPKVWQPRVIEFLRAQGFTGVAGARQ